MQTKGKRSASEFLKQLKNNAPRLDRHVGTICREFPAFISFCNGVDFDSKLEFFEDYYNRSRAHASPDGNTPADISPDRVAQHVVLDYYACRKHCGGLCQLPAAS